MQFSIVCPLSLLVCAGVVPPTIILIGVCRCVASYHYPYWCVQVWCLLPLDLGGGLSRGGMGGGGRFPSTSSDDSSPLNGEAVGMCVCVCAR